MNEILSDIDLWLKEAEAAPTSHPSASADDGDQPATTGARASENESDVKQDIPGDNVDSASGDQAEGPGRGENNPINSIGTKATATGEDSSVETASVKSSPDDPGTAHPAKADMGEKYSAAEALIAGDEILADISGVAAAAKQAAEAKQAEKEKAAEAEAPAEEEKEAEAEKPEEEEKAAEAETSDEGEKEAEAEKPEEEEKSAEQAGAEAAEAVTEVTGVGKEAELAASVLQTVALNIVKAAEADAKNVAEFLQGLADKQAMDAGDGGEVMEETSEAVEEAPVEAPVEAPMPDAAAPAGDADLQELVQMLIDAGVTPEELMALAAGGAQGAAPAEEAMAMPAEAPAEIMDPSKAASIAAALAKNASNALQVQNNKAEASKGE